MEIFLPDGRLPGCNVRFSRLKPVGGFQTDPDQHQHQGHLDQHPHHGGQGPAPEESQKSIVVVAMTCFSYGSA